MRQRQDKIPRPDETPEVQERQPAPAADPAAREPGSPVPAGEEQYQQLIDNLFEGVYFIDRGRRITYWNEAAERITGYSRAEVLGSRCRDGILIHIDEQGESLCCTDRCPALAAMQSGVPSEREVYLHHKDGHRLPVSTRIFPLRDAQGEVAGVMEAFWDNSPLVAMLSQSEELKRLALVDPLTEIGNRRYLEIHLRGRLDEMERYGWRFGLLFCDIDSFKRFNDRYGHAAGDKVIRMAASTLASCIRPSDFIGRWGGEEFMAIITRVERWQLLAIAERLRVMVEQSMISAGKEQLRVTISVGATLACPGDTEEALFQRVDSLLYQSKTTGANRVSIDETSDE